MLHYFALFSDDIRTGATFVHDLFAAAVVIVSGGHVWMALKDPEARRGLRTGYVTREWAEAEHALWAAELTSADSAKDPDARAYRPRRRAASSVMTSVAPPPMARMRTSR